MINEEELILSLLNCDVLRIGDFKLKSGASSPIYIDLRRIICYPEVVKNLVAAIKAKQTEENIEVDMVCGVPYTAIPIASVFSAFYNISMIMKRKEAKKYGTGKQIEGIFKTGDSCLIIEDIVCSGTSIMDTIEVLRKEGLVVQHCIVVINKNQGGIDNLKKVGLNVYPLLHIDSIFNAYCKINKVESEVAAKITSYFKDNFYMPIYKENNFATLSYAERALISTHPMAKQLLQIMEDKKTNLCYAIDVHNCHELLKISDKVGPHICLLKTHIELLHNFDESEVEKLTKLASQHNFLILEDRKFAESGNTVIHQYKKGIYKIEAWADLITTLAVSGSSTIEALKSCTKTEKRAAILTIEMNSSNIPIDENCKKSMLDTASIHADFVIGYMALQRYSRSKNLICIYAGLNTALDSLIQKHNQPEDAVSNGADIVILDKEMLKETVETDIETSVIEYKTRSFQAYLNRIS